MGHPRAPAMHTGSPLLLPESVAPVGNVPRHCRRRPGGPVMVPEARGLTFGYVALDRQTGDTRAGRSAIAYAGGDLQIRVRGDGLAEQQQERKRQEARGHLHLQTNTMLASEIYEQSRCRNRLPGQGSYRAVLREAV